MEYVVYSNGHRSDWDETITVGSLISAYHSGYHIVTNIEHKPHDHLEAGFGSRHLKIVEQSNPAFDSVPTISYQKVMNEDGMPSKKLKNTCSSYYCRKVTKEEILQQADKEILQALTKKDALLKYV